MKVGDKFKSFEDAENAVKMFGEQTYTNYYIRNCAKMKEPNILVYSRITFCCVQGGRSVKIREHRLRKTKTFKTGCSASISFKLSSDRDFLQVGNCSHEHNHETSEASYLSHPQQRICPEDVVRNTKLLFQLKCNKKLLQKKLQEETGKMVTMKDVWNMDQKFKKETKNGAYSGNELLAEKHELCPPPTRRIASKSVQEKKREALTVLQSIADLVSEGNMETFKKRMDVIKKLQSSWSSGMDVTVTPCQSDNTNIQDLTDLTGMTEEVVMTSGMTPVVSDSAGMGEPRLEMLAISSFILDPASMGNEVVMTSGMTPAVSGSASMENAILGVSAISTDVLEPLTEYLNLRDVTLPKVAKVKGRTKGKKLSVTGIPKKKKGKQVRRSDND